MNKDDKKNKKQKFQKLSFKFMKLAIIPSVFLMLLFVIISFVATVNISFKNLKGSLSGQAQAKSSGVSNTVNAAIKNINIDILSNQLSKYIINEKSDERYTDIKATVDEIHSKNVQFRDVGVAVFDINTVIKSSGDYEFSWNGVWYEDDKMSAGKPYYHFEKVNDSASNSMITYVLPLKDENRNNIGALIIDFNDYSMFNVLKLDTGFKQQCWFIVNNENGQIIFSSDEHARDIYQTFSKISPGMGINNINNWKLLKDTYYIPYVFKIESFPDISCYYAVHATAIIKNSMVTLIMVAALTMMCLIMIAVFVRIFTSKILSEINDILRSLRRVKQGNYTDKITPHSKDELGMLADEFNTVIETLKFQSEHDNMTQFYNSITFAEKAHEFVQSDIKKKYAVIRIDIDNFSFVNDIFDWNVGNEILIKIADIIKEVFDIGVVYGYLGNDVFVVCLAYDVKNTIYLKINKAAEKIRNSDSRIPVIPHFGVFENAKQDSDLNVLCDYAGVALKTIKGNMLETYAIYDEKFHEVHELQKFVESNKKAALEKNDFYIVLQPKCDIHTGEVVGAEALVRWRSIDNKKELSPSKFIPIFEKNGFIITLDRYVWEETCKVLKRWQDKGFRQIPISVNVSRMHIFHPEFVNDFENLVKRYEIPPHLLEVEVTESALLENIDGILGIAMNDLKSRGFKLLMDDFASGYSSLIALQNLPFDVIKVDKALIDHIDEPANKQFVSGVISFLQDLKKEIVVEGVENESQKQCLMDTGCNIIQGFCFSKPVSVEAFEVLAFGEEAVV